MPRNARRRRDPTAGRPRARARVRARLRRAIRPNLRQTRFSRLRERLPWPRACLGHVRHACRVRPPCPAPCRDACRTSSPRAREDPSTRPVSVQGARTRWGPAFRAGRWRSWATGTWPIPGNRFAFRRVRTFRRGSVTVEGGSLHTATLKRHSKRVASEAGCGGFPGAACREPCRTRAGTRASAGRSSRRPRGREWRRPNRCHSQRAGGVQNAAKK
jgi:hypothetical protein